MYQTMCNHFHARLLVLITIYLLTELLIYMMSRTAEVINTPINHSVIFIKETKAVSTKDFGEL